MSYEAVIGKIDQILQWQQQIQDPAGATPTSATGTAGGTTSATSGASSAFAAALANAQATAAGQAINPQTASASGTLGQSGSLTSLLDSQLGGSLGTSPTGSVSAGGNPLTSILSMLGSTPAASTAPTYAATTATGAADPRVQAMVQEANSLVGKPYVWGGGHSGWGPQAGYDCSGFVSAVLHAGGYLTTPQDTTTLPSAPGIEQGPGQYVTIYDRSQPGENGHVIIEIDGQFYESGGEHGSWGGGGGVERIATPSAAYLATFDTILHPAGL